MRPQSFLKKPPPAWSRLTLVLLRVLDILLFRKLKVRLTLYFSDSTFEGIMYLSHSLSSILFRREHVSQHTSPHAPSGDV